MRAPVKVVAAVIWAVVVGFSVPLAVCNTSFLNRAALERGVDTSLHGFYILQISVAMGGLQLTVPSFRSKEVWSRPVRWWPWLGGVCGLFGFVTVSATPLLGVQVVITMQLLGILVTFFMFDILDGTVKFGDWQKPLGFTIAVLGVAMDNLSIFQTTQHINADWIFHFAGTFLSGVGYALQAKCNGALAQDIGGPARAAMVSAAVNFTAGVPIAFYIAYGRGVPLTLDASLWPLWPLAGLQSAFYIGSMAVLPKLLGFTTCYLAVLSSKLVSSSLADELALSGTQVPVTMNRAVALLFVMVGAYIFNACGKQGPPTRDAAVVDADEVEKALLIEEHLNIATSAVVKKSDGNVLLAK